MHAETYNDILSAIGLPGKSYRNIEGGVACLPLPEHIEGTVLSRCFEEAKCTVRYAEVDVAAQQLRIKVDLEPPERKPEHDICEPPDCKLEGLSPEDADNVRAVLAALTSASMDGVQPQFDMLIQPTQCIVYACKPATKYDHLVLADVLGSQAIAYDNNAHEVRVVVQLATPSAKRRRAN